MILYYQKGQVKYWDCFKETLRQSQDNENDTLELLDILTMSNHYYFFANTAYLARWSITGSTWNSYGTTQLPAATYICRYLSATQMFIAGNWTRIPATTGTIYMNSLIFDQSSGSSTFSNLSYAFLNNSGLHSDNSNSTLIDADGVLYVNLNSTPNINNTAISGVNNGNPNNQKFIQVGAPLGIYYDTTTNSWVPLCNDTSSRPSGPAYASTSTLTGTPGEIWFGGNITYLDGTLMNLSGLVSYQKNNRLLIKPTNMIKNGRTDYTTAQMLYKGQTLELISDGTNWIVLGDNGNNYVYNGPPIVFF